MMTTKPVHDNDASHVCLGTFSPNSSALNPAENNGPVATMASTDAMYVNSAATMNAMFCNVWQGRLGLSTRRIPRSTRLDSNQAMLQASYRHLRETTASSKFCMSARVHKCMSVKLSNSTCSERANE